MSGSRWEKEVETRGRLPFVRGSFSVDQQSTLDASESGVPVVNGDRSLVVAGLINEARRLCLSFLSESTPFSLQARVGQFTDGILAGEGTTATNRAWRWTLPNSCVYVLRLPGCERRYSRQKTVSLPSDADARWHRRGAREESGTVSKITKSRQ